MCKFKCLNVCVYMSISSLPGTLRDQKFETKTRSSEKAVSAFNS